MKQKKIAPCHARKKYIGQRSFAALHNIHSSWNSGEENFFLFFLSQLFVQIAQCSVIVPKTKARAFYSWHLIQFRYFAKQFVSMCFWTCAYYLSLIAIICNGKSDRSAATIKTTIPTTVPATVNTTKDNHQMNINFEISMKQFFLLI